MLTAGNVTISNDGTPSGSGMARAIFDAIFAQQLIAAQVATLTAESRLATQRGWATVANAIGGAVVAYIVEHADVTLAGAVATVSTESLGKLPATVAAGAPIDPPDASVPLPVTGAGRIA